MDKRISTLSQDIYKVLDSSQAHAPNSELAAKYARDISGELAKSTLLRNKKREKGKLWASDIGKPCLRQHWYSFNMPEQAESLQGHTKFKFLYGNIIESAVLYLAEEAGHIVTHQQLRVELNKFDWKITGRIDGVIDNVLVDVKSTSSYGFTRYTKYGINSNNDTCGYRYQLGFYIRYIDVPHRPLTSGFLWVDKQNGYIAYCPVAVPTTIDIESKIVKIINAVTTVEESSVCKAFEPVAYGSSGNKALPTACSYCPYKQKCWESSNEGKGLKGYKYSSGPVWFTTVKKVPNVPSI